ncbi:MAG: 16S rRNA (adenine(1518)-N(6)/adenine(1519)-N(6))-dimethyltransferase RsmA [Anaerolineae bacterium]|nr:16S rRNA (adenine(1518)-N(6)/adenine(1519)-N(6))-dimethyltransferase RsmA [Anaerolineae bacterium]MDW8069810.1 16S rRNA (adenine(1518)-N(6)/adenine(1519)-N(6))-dimethyltransferase RsmA [Anaerolineae bacterium]
MGLYGSARQILCRYGLEPRRELGQHFLVDEAALARIVAAAELTLKDAVLEVGAGVGNLTRLLSEAAARVVAVEIDRRFLPVLEAELADRPNVRLVAGDILALDPADLMGEGPYQVVANLPYAITSAVLRHLLEARVPPQRMVVTVQKEVAERIIARGGRMSLLAVSVQFYGRPRLLFRLRPGAFYPPPEVDSAVLRIDRHPQPPVEGVDVEAFFRVVRAGFSHPRKQLSNSLAAGLGISPEMAADALRAASIDPRTRAERLSLEDWARLTRVLWLSSPGKCSSCYR